jgi:hypothetical protein
VREQKDARPRVDALTAPTSNSKGGRGEGRLKAEMRMRARLRRSWRGVITHPQNQPTAWFMGFCAVRTVYFKDGGT